MSAAREDRQSLDVPAQHTPPSGAGPSSDPIPPQFPGEPWTLPPIRYVQVVAGGPRTARWAIPEHERARCESPQSSWGWRSTRPPAADPERDPFLCAGCNAPLTSWARARGFVYCNANCRERSTRHT